jgi:hypothetical protein
VIVAENQIVDSADAGIAGGREDALRVTRGRGVARLRREGAVARKSGVEKDRLAARRSREHGLPALDIDDVDVERSRRRGVGDRPRASRHRRDRGDGP